MVYKRLSAHDVLVITEDILSAIKMGRYADTIALLTAHDKDEVVSLCKGYEKVIIYLDNDNAHVRDAQERLKARIGLVNRNVVVYRGDKDPKECSDDELLQIVNGQY
jgi:allophanate hydrolase subunit 1